MPLVPEGDTLATSDPDTAARLVVLEVERLERIRRGIRVAGIGEGATLEAWGADHLILKAEEGTSYSHLVNLEIYLKAASGYFGAARLLDSISTADVKGWIRHLATLDNGRGGKLSTGTQRKYLNALSDLFQRAVSEGKAQTNPARELYGKPKPARVEARYWEPHEVGLLLESARTLPPEPAQRGRGSGGAATADRFPWLYPLLATAALTGLRKRELFGLLVDDVSFKLGRVFVRPNAFRELKTGSSERHVPLWPQLEEILRAYMLDRERVAPLGSLLFPSHRHQEEKLLDNVDRMLDQVGARVKIEKPRLHAFRHSYTAARIQTLHAGAPVHIWQVARELGHESTGMIERRYGHLAHVLERSEVVEFRVEKHLEEVRDRLEALEPGRW
jgi:integrase